MLLLAAIAFVGTHFLLSHPLRAPMVRATGEGPFIGIYSAVAFGTLAWMVLAYIATPATPPWWTVGDGLWAVATVLMLIASILLAGSLVGNPAFPKPGAPNPAPDVARGVYAVTRHPMMWSFTVWGMAHMLVYPVGKTFIVTLAVIVLSLVGAALQDRKKERLQPQLWPAWERQTSYFPFAAVVAGRAHLGGFGPYAWLGGLAFWLAATWAHGPLSGWPAGIWRWIAR
ncbi:MAG: NnrU family protein [Pseudomonadota bacterium]|nr:NnrU family protein [Pseudomonadota bacterium]